MEWRTDGKPRGTGIVQFGYPSTPIFFSDKNLAVMLAQFFARNLSKTKRTRSLPASEGSSHNLERRGSVHQHGATVWYLMRGKKKQGRLVSAGRCRHGGGLYPTPLETPMKESRLTHIITLRHPDFMVSYCSIQDIFIFVGSTASLPNGRTEPEVLSKAHLHPECKLHLHVNRHNERLENNINTIKFDFKHWFSFPLISS